MINFFIFILITIIVYNYLNNIETFGLKWENNEQNNNSDQFFNNTSGFDTTTTNATVCMRPNANKYQSNRINILDKINKSYDLNNCKYHSADWETANLNKLNSNVDKIPQIYNCLTNKSITKQQKKVKNIFYKSGSKKINNVIVPEKYIKVKLRNTKKYLHLKDNVLTFKDYQPVDLSSMNTDLQSIKNSITNRLVIHAKNLQKSKLYDKYYWDNQCTACPAKWYGHCSKGGTLYGERGCGFLSAGCEGKCKTGSHYNPIIIRTQHPDVHLLLEFKNKKQTWNKSIFNLKIIGMKKQDLDRINMFNNDTITNINKKLDLNLIRSNMVKNYSITGNIEHIINTINKMIDSQIVDINLNKNQTSPFCWEFLTESEINIIKKIILNRFQKALEETYYKLTFNKLSKYNNNNLVEIKVKSKAIDDDDKINILGFFGKLIIDKAIQNNSIKHSNSQVTIQKISDLIVKTDISDNSFPVLQNNKLPKGSWKNDSKDSRLLNGNNVLETSLKTSNKDEPWKKNRIFIQQGASYNNVNGKLKPDEKNSKILTQSTYGFEALEFEDLDGSLFDFIKPTDLLTAYVCNIPNSKKAWIDKKEDMDNDQWSQPLLNKEYSGNDIGVIINSKDIEACKNSCFNDNNCVAITYETNTKKCYPKSAIGETIDKKFANSYIFNRKPTQRKGNYICPKSACYNKKLDNCVNPPKMKVPKKCSKETVDDKLKKAIKRKFNEASDDKFTKEADRILSELSSNGMKIKEDKTPSNQIRELHKHMHDFHKNQSKNIKTHSKQ